MFDSSSLAVRRRRTPSLARALNVAATAWLFAVAGAVRAHGGTPAPARAMTAWRRAAAVRPARRHVGVVPPPPRGEAGSRTAAAARRTAPVVLQSISAAERARRCPRDGGEAQVEGFSLYTPSDSASLVRNKAALLAAAERLGASADERLLLLAMAMIETENMKLVERDICKDGTLAENLTAMNLGLDLLLHIGLSDAEVAAIAAQDDDQRSIALGAEAALRGIRQLGIDPYVLRLRAGYGDATEAEVAPYRAALAATRAELSAEPALLTDGRRYGTSVAHLAAVVGAPPAPTRRRRH